MSDATSPNAHFLAGETGGPPAAKARLGGSLFFSVATHGIILLVFGILAAARMADTIADVVTPRIEVIWIDQPAPGGGGGGSPDPAPVKKAEIPKQKPAPIPDVPKPAVELPKEIAPPAPPTVPITSSISAMPGDITGLPNAAGTGGGGGSGTGVGG